ncbi:EamA family transporter [Chloroflexota bacterium]
MNWASATLLSTIIMGWVSLIDSHLLSQRMPGLRTFLIPTGVIHLFSGLVIFFSYPLPEGLGVLPVLAVLISSAIRTVGLIIMLEAFKREEVSRVIPIVHTSPVFVAIMAAPLLGETLSYMQWLAIIIVVAGAIIVTAEKSPSASTGQLSKPFLLLFVSSLLLAIADIGRKYALGYMSFWNGFSLSEITTSVLFLLFALRPHTLRQIRDMKHRNASLGLLTFSESLALVAIMLSFWAVKNGPVSLVVTIMGSRPVFVAVFSFVLGFISPRFLLAKTVGRRVLVLRFLATALIVGGISIIYLT